VKPANFVGAIVGKTGVIDFEDSKGLDLTSLSSGGLSGKVDLLMPRREKVTMCTPKYVSPEHATPDRMVSQSDWFSLGLVACSLFAEAALRDDYLAIHEPSRVQDTVYITMKRHPVGCNFADGVAETLYADLTRRNLDTLKIQLDNYLNRSSLEN
jgi:hypothetical protein